MPSSALPTIHSVHPQLLFELSLTCVLSVCLVAQALRDSMNQQGQSGEGKKQIQIMLQDMEGQQAGKTG
jgi:hypothetical protein